MTKSKKNKLQSSINRVPNQINVVADVHVTDNNSFDAGNHAPEASRQLINIVNNVSNLMNDDNANNR